MKARAALATATLALIVLVACAPGASAESPPAVSSVGPGDAVVTPLPVPTSTPWPRFGPPQVTADSITATVQSAPGGPSDSSTVNSQPTATAVPENAESLPGWGPLAGTVTPTPLPDATAVDRSGTFVPVLPYAFVLPQDWEEIVGDDEIVIADPTGQAQVTLRERQLSRSSIDSIESLAPGWEPIVFVDWAERSRSELRATGSSSYRAEYAGMKLGEQRVAIVDWYLWGEMLVEVVIEAEASAWALDSKLRNTAMLVASSFAPDRQDPLAGTTDVENLLRVRFNDRQSNIFSDSSSGLAPSELSCRQVFYDLLSVPVYVDSGEWQVFAVSEQGVQVWRVFEPKLNIIPAAHNTSNC